ncbi:MAG: sulfotransferase [Acidimicrobiia bacterium]|nr:sulfotransferase [Acidimicrobiia bacterium]
MTSAVGPLSVDALIEGAVAKAGHDRFGDPWFREPLEVLVGSLNGEARLSETGRVIAEHRLGALLVDRLRLRSFQEEHPEVLDVDVRVAAVICGLPRTGSTLLHRMLAASPQLTATMGWECSFPLPFPGEGPEAEIRKARAKEMMEAFLAMSPDFGDIHTVVWDGAEEEVLILDRAFTTMGFDSFYWAPTYGRWLRSFDQAPSYAELRQWLQVLQWQDPSREGRRWVLKSPHHLTALDTVLDEFPDARIVMTHRSTTQAVPSYASMCRAMMAMGSDEIDPVAVGRYWSDRFRESLGAFVEIRPRRPDRFVDVPFLATVEDPVGTAARVMTDLGFTVGDADRAAFEGYRDENEQERRGAHSYTAEEFGLSEAQLERDFAFYTEAYL